MQLGKEKKEATKGFFLENWAEVATFRCSGVMEVVRTKRDFHKVLLSRLISRQIWLINVVNGHPFTCLTKLKKQNPDLVTES